MTAGKTWAGTEKRLRCAGVAVEGPDQRKNVQQVEGQRQTGSWSKETWLRRMPGEFEPHRGTLMIWPVRPGSWGVNPKESQDAFLAVMKVIAEGEVVFLAADPAHVAEAEQRTAAAGITNIQILEIDNNDAWARDTGPTFIYERIRDKARDGARDKVCDEIHDGTGDRIHDRTDAAAENAGRRTAGISWSFNAWGGTVDGLYADWEKDDALAEQFLKQLGVPCISAGDFVLEGGSIHSDGQGTLMVTESCLLSAGRNPDLSKSQIEANLKTFTGCEKVLWLPRGIYNDETNEHVDNVCAFTAPGEVVLAWTDKEEDPQYALSKACLDYLEGETDARGRKLVIHKLPIPDVPILLDDNDCSAYSFEPGEDTREPGERLAASYVNFYIANAAILVPQFGGENAASDRRALKILRPLFPDRAVTGIDARAILMGGGNIHCITQQMIC